MGYLPLSSGGRLSTVLQMHSIGHFELRYNQKLRQCRLRLRNVAEAQSRRIRYISVLNIVDGGVQCRQTLSLDPRQLLIRYITLRKVYGVRPKSGGILEWLAVISNLLHEFSHGVHHKSAPKHLWESFVGSLQCVLGQGYKEIVPM